MLIDHREIKGPVPPVRVAPAFSPCQSSPDQQKPALRSSRGIRAAQSCLDGAAWIEGVPWLDGAGAAWIDGATAGADA